MRMRPDRVVAVIQEQDGAGPKQGSEDRQGEERNARRVDKPVVGRDSAKGSGEKGIARVG